jgi:Transcriptional regulatory protein, C terminal
MNDLKEKLAYFSLLAPIMKFKIKKFFLFAFLFILGNTKGITQNYTEYGEKHLSIVLRDIGHQILLSANDSTSRVLPIKKVSENVYQIEFQSQFAFITDTLINLVYSRLKNSNLPSEYIVSILNCADSDIIYGYEVSKKSGNIIPCTGRSQPKGCYKIQIQFLPENKQNYAAFLLFLIPVVFLGYFMKKKYFTNTKILPTDNELFLPIGNFKFYANKNLLISPIQSIELTEKETKLLQIFANNMNQTVDREMLLKEIWESEGTIVVSRSLDVLVSKLRKKTESDSTIRFQNVHGKGYKMVIG